MKGVFLLIWPPRCVLVLRVGELPSRTHSTQSLVLDVFLREITDGDGDVVDRPRARGA
jgi:hypothetical protein